MLLHFLHELYLSVVTSSLSPPDLSSHLAGADTANCAGGACANRIKDTVSESSVSRSSLTLIGDIRKGGKKRRKEGGREIFFRYEVHAVYISVV